MSQVSLRQVTKVLGSGANQYHFPSITVEFATGEFVAIVGPSGVGKSTLLRLIAGLETHDSGEIHFDNVKVDSLSSHERNVGMVFQNYALFPHLTVAENLGYSLSVKNVGKALISSDVKDVAKRLAIGDLLDRYPRQLSGGQRQRVAIGRAMLSKPQLFLFDEPFSNLDPELRKQMRQQLKDLHLSLAATTLFVTHDQHEAMALAQRILLLSETGIEQFDTPQNIYQYPSNLYVARFFGDPKINEFKAWADREGVHIDCGTTYSLKCDLPSELYNSALSVGVRPRAFSLSVDAKNHGLRMQLTQIEYLGDTQYLYLSPLEGSHKNIAVVADDDQISVNHMVYVTFSLQDILLFDENSQRIPLENYALRDIE